MCPFTTTIACLYRYIAYLAHMGAYMEICKHNNILSLQRPPLMRSSLRSLQRASMRREGTCSQGPRRCRPTRRARP